MPVVVLDVGSSFLKSAITDPETGALSAVRRIPMPARIPGPATRHELDPLELRNRVVAQLEAHRAAAANLTDVLISTQMHCFVVTDTAGHPVSPVITWQDRRVGEDDTGPHSAAVARLFAHGQERIGGVPLRPGLPAATLAHWLDEHRTGAGLEFHTLGSYLIRSLTGRHATHISSAAATGLTDIATGTWHRSAIETIGAGKLIFPEISSGPVGRWRAAGQEISIWSDVGDHQAGLYGVGAEVDDIVISLGTAGIATRVVDDATLQPGTELRPSVNGHRLRTVTGLPSGRFLQRWVERAAEVEGDVRSADPAPMWERLAESIPVEVASEFTRAFGPALTRLTDPGSRPRLHFTGGVAARLPGLVSLLAGLVSIRDHVVHCGDATLTGLARLAADAELDVRTRIA